MISKKSGKIIWLSIVNLLILFSVSIFVLNGAQGAALYSAVAALFFFSGVFLKRAYVFTGILVLVVVTAFIVQVDIFETINFFINSKG